MIVPMSVDESIKLVNIHLTLYTSRKTSQDVFKGYPRVH
jgi:hypothetical protein